jgi:hypothetical protein
MIRPIIVFVLLTFSQIAAAQSIEVFGGGGYGRAVRFGDDVKGSGFTWEAGIGFSPTERLGLQAHVLQMRNRLSGDVEHVPEMLFAGGQVLFYFLNSPIRPFISGGAGVLRTREITTITFPGSRIAVETTESAFAANFGGGLDVALGERFFVRPRISFAPGIASTSNLHFFNLVMQAGVRW